MTNKSTKRALIMSVLSLLVCISMLIGTTFAWFTDSVTSANNIIKSGNLDVKLEYSTNATAWTEVTSSTEIFDDATLWEPGHTEVVYLKVSNIGSLALKYKLAVNIVEEKQSVNVADKVFKLSDYIYAGIVDDQSTAFADRAAARAAVTTPALINTGFADKGSIVAKGADQYVALVVYMPETVGNEANHKKDVDAPQIKLGITLMATQEMEEKDSFDEKYDENALYDVLPTATVTDADQYENVEIDWGSYGAWSPSNPDQQLEAAYVFKAQDDATTVQESEFKDWHCDYYVSIDKDITAKQIFLGGNYGSFGWIGFENPIDVTANEWIPLLGSVTQNPWTYEAIVTNVGEFTCGVAEYQEGTLTGATFTVQLRLTNPDDATDYKVVSEIKHTF